MTFSIVATDGTAAGVAVASKFLAVGSVVPYARLGSVDGVTHVVGAAATQAMAKWSYKIDALDHLRGGHDAAYAIAQVTAADDDREHRQLGVVGADSQATYTGSACMDWAGGRSGADDSGRYAIQGNILTGEQVVADMEHAWLDSAGDPFERRLVAALLAGDAAGGDSRGRQSAALLVVSPGAGYDASGVLVDLRVDDDPDAPHELARLLDLNDLYFGGPQGVQPLAGELGVEVTERLATLGYSGGDVAQALESWAGVENYEMRLSPDGIDVRVLAALRQATD
ncbi:DUF1028 domain-containing protein [Lapillicoccus sp.]|uniref:DUF1028 domain-containing protein n=1 Tax=Lapillicoccus sp. TaxID=1909287 RepID=UPI0032650130